MAERMITISEKEYNELRLAKIQMDAVMDCADIGDELSDAMAHYIEILKNEENWDALIPLTSWYSPGLYWIDMGDIENSFMNNDENQYDFTEDEFEILKAHYESLYCG